jgi:hypothetical protein
MSASYAGVALLLRTAILLSAIVLAASAPPNILWILADDLDNDWKQSHLDIMPNLRTAIREKGVHFENHVAAQPVCGPSRSSLLQGRFPHNVKYWANEDPDSVANYLAVANNTVGTWLTAAGCKCTLAPTHPHPCQPERSRKNAPQMPT